MSRELEAVALWRDGGGGLWMGRSGPERPWNWLTGTDASPDDLLLRLRQEPRDVGMAGLLEVGARHGGLPRRIGARPQMDAGYDETAPRQRAMHTEAVGRFIPIANCHIRVWLPLAGFGPNH